MIIHVPKEIEHYEPELHYFLQTMVLKLHTNRHKGFAEQTDLETLMTQMRLEMKEAEAAWEKESQFAFFVECVDVSNQAWLAGLKALRMTKSEWQEK